MHDLPLHRIVLIAIAAAAVFVVGWRSMSHGAAPRAAYGASAPPPPAQTGPAVVVVDVVGAVLHPGVYRLAGGARVQDAVRRAGVARSADLSGVNLAARLADGEQVVVPRHGQAVASLGTGGAGAGTAPAIVHLNSATLEQLETLDGIG